MLRAARLFVTARKFATVQTRQIGAKACSGS